LHPFIPFVTEELGHHLPIHEEESIMMASYPKFNKKYIHPKATKEIEMLKEIISYIRNVRGEHTVSPSKLISATLVSKDTKVLEILKRNEVALQTLAKLSELHFSEKAMEAKNMAVGALGFLDVFIPITDLVDVEEEKKRLQKELEKINTDLVGLQTRLSNEAFIERAPKDIVQKERDRLSDLQSKKQKLEQNLQKLFH